MAQVYSLSFHTCRPPAQTAEQVCWPELSCETCSLLASGHMPPLQIFIVVFSLFVSISPQPDVLVRVFLWVLFTAVHILRPLEITVHISCHYQVSTLKVFARSISHILDRGLWVAPNGAHTNTLSQRKEGLKGLQQVSGEIYLYVWTPREGGFLCKNH